MFVFLLSVTKNYFPAVAGNFPAGKILLLVLAIPIGASLINFCLSHSILGYGYRLFVAPGVIVHEISHALACLATGARIQAFSIFDKSGGRVEHYKPKIPIIGQIVISLAPFVGGGVVIYFLARMVGLSEIDPVSVSPGLTEIKSAIIYLTSSVDYGSYQNLLLIYLLVSVAVTMNPSLQDIKNISVTIFFLALVFGVLWKLTAFRPDLGFWITQTPRQIVVMVATIDLVLLLSLILSIMVFAVSKLIKPM